MGKIKKTRSRPNPDTVPEEVVEDELELSADSQENVVRTIVDQLQSVNVEEKYCGLQTFATLIEDQSRLQELLSSEIIKIAAPLLIDSSHSVRNSAAGALNNLSRCGYEVCDQMMERDVMTPLIAYFHEHAVNLTAKGNDYKKYDEEGETLIQCISMLLNLCETSELAVKYFNTSNILMILLKYLDYEAFGSDITISVLQCLFVVSEDNTAVTEKIKSEGEEKLMTLLQIEGNEPTQILLRTLAAGVTINTCGGNIATLPAPTISRIISVLASALSTDHRQICNELSSKVPISEGSSKAKLPKGKEGEVLELEIKSVMRLLNAQQTSVEIIANVFSCEDNEDSMDADDSSDSDDLADDSINDCSTNGINDQISLLDKLPPEVSEAMDSYQLFDKVFSKSFLPPDNTMTVLVQFENTASLCNVISNLQSRSLLCVSNMLSTLPLAQLGGAPGVYRVWVEAGKHAFRNNPAAHVMESATATMRSALYRIQSGAGDVEGLFKELALSDIEMLLSGAKECAVAEVRGNLVRMLGSLALLLAGSRAAAAADVVVAITTSILEQAFKENEVWVLAECVDTLLDLYSEDETDALASRTGLVEKLTRLAPVLKSKARQQRKRLGEHSVVVNTATANLPRFIKYKRERLATLGARE